MSILTYNGLTFPCNQTVQFEQSAEHDPVGSVDWYCTKYTIRATCLIHMDDIPVITALIPDAEATDRSSIIVSQNAPAIIRALRNRFMKTRKRLSFLVNGVEQIPLITEGNTGPVDAKNGPFPQYFNHVFITDSSVLLLLEVISYHWENLRIEGSDIRNQPSSPVLYNRWEEKVSLDSRDLSTLTRTGVFQIRADNVEKKTADEFRDSFAVLSIRPEFIRKQRDYQVTPDGLCIKYTVVDEEQIKMPPNVYSVNGPIVGTAYEAQIDYKERTGKAAAVRYGSCHVFLSGSKSIPGASLLQTAVGIAINKVLLTAREKKFAPLKPNSPFVILGTDLNYDFYKNTVHFTLNVQYTLDQKRFGGVAGLNYDITADPVPKNDTKTPTYKPRGFAGIILEAAAYYDPNLLDNKLGVSKLNPTGGNQMNHGKIPGQGGG